MAQLVEAYHSIAASPEFRETVRQRERARHNEASALANAALKERRKNVRHMYKEGLSVEMIVKYLGLSVEDVKKFLNRK